MEQMGFIEKTKSFLFTPIETFKKVREEDIGVGLKYFIIWLVIYAALTTVVSLVVGAMLGSIYRNIPGFSGYGSFLGVIVGPIAAVISFIMILLSGFVGIFIGSALIHIGVLLVGGKKGYNQTIKAVMYGITPAFLLGWIPIAGIIFSLWSLLLEILGVRELQEISTGKAILAVLLPVIAIAIVVAIAIMMYVFVSGMIGSGP
jgi:hypothetical protein